MDFKKCDRCGTFFSSSDAVCACCAQKDKLEVLKLKTFFEQNDSTNSIPHLSSITGITTKNLNRHLTNDDFSDFSDQFELK